MRNSSSARRRGQSAAAPLPPFEPCATICVVCVEYVESRRRRGAGGVQPDGERETCIVDEAGISHVGSAAGQALLKMARDPVLIDRRAREIRAADCESRRRPGRSLADCSASQFPCTRVADRIVDRLGGAGARGIGEVPGDRHFERARRAGLRGARDHAQLRHIAHVLQEAIGIETRLHAQPDNGGVRRRHRSRAP